jgi:hypothetical protein
MTFRSWTPLIAITLGLIGCSEGAEQRPDPTVIGTGGGSQNGSSGQAGNSSTGGMSGLGGSAGTSQAGSAGSAAGTMAGSGGNSGGSSGSGGSGGSSGSGNAGMAGQGGSTTCPEHVICVDTFPFQENQDTSQSTLNMLDSYNCQPNADESGPEIVYRVHVPKDGFLSAAVVDSSGVDIDVHILSAWDANTCLTRGDKHAKADVTAGDYWIIADTYVSQGTPQAGAFQMNIGFIEPSKGPCGMEVGEMPRVGDGGNTLKMPATGPIVTEAHLVTAEEPPPYPQTASDMLWEHYQLSQKKTGMVMFRKQVWAPLEGGTFYGAGIGSPTLFPVMDEGYYVNMYWTSQARPPRGTRMILRDPQGGSRAVVVAAGYETGPGNLAHIGGTPEETHFYMGTTHLDPMTLGIATDQSLPLGPRICE